MIRQIAVLGSGTMGFIGTFIALSRLRRSGQTSAGKSGQIGHAHGDHASRAGHKLGGPRTFHPMFGHIIHLAVATRVEPGCKARFGVRQIDVADADRAETQFASPVPDTRSERRQLRFIEMTRGRCWIIRRL